MRENLAALKARDALGRFPKGVSGNPQGRPSVPADVRQELQEIFEAAAPDAARKLVALVQDEDPRVSTTAAIHILDRLLGRVTQNIDATVKTTSVQEAHLAALQELNRRREERLRQEQVPVGYAKMIDAELIATVAAAEQPNEVDGRKGEV